MIRFDFNGFEFRVSPPSGRDRRYYQVMYQGPSTASLVESHGVDAMLREQDRVLDELTDLINSHEIGKRMAYDRWWLNNTKALNFLMLLVK